MAKIEVLKRGNRYAVYANGEFIIDCLKEQNALFVKKILEEDEKPKEEM